MSDYAKEAIREITRALKDLHKVSSTRVIRDGDHFSFALPERPATSPSPAPKSDPKKDR